MPEPSDINSHELEHRLANIRLKEMEDTNHPSSSSSSLSSFNRHQHKRILIVDDNSDIAFTLRIGLENNNALCRFTVTIIP